MNMADLKKLYNDMGKQRIKVKSPKSTKPKCPLRWSIVPLTELPEDQVPYLAQWAGQEVRIAGPNDPATPDPNYMSVLLGDQWTGVSKDMLRAWRRHTFVDTGMQWSYCKVCDCDGCYDVVSGMYVRKNRSKRA